MTEATFDACIQAILKGDKQGLRDIYDAYLDYIYRIVYGVVGSREDAEDITSEFFIKLWQQADRYKAGSGHKAYLATIARNMAIDHTRKYKKEVLESFTKDDDDDVVIEPVSSDNTEAEVIEDIAIKEAIGKLNPKEQQIINMKILSEMTFQEISDILKCPMGTVTWRYREAIKKLRRYGYYEES
ncbi:RNA polymerase sigma-70 factor, ECF subfamily [Lachnospiraceae bacterium YSD2013]|nr:RNA polymerase sigma-70 factor, ECF subfamily [Lachnospiraceae bacterium YSD2013]